MSETRRWTPMSDRASGRMFGIYREPDPERSHRTSMNLKLLTFLGVLAASALTVCFVSLMLTKTSFPELKEEQPMNVSPDDHIAKTPANATAPGDGVQETLSRPTVNNTTETYHPLGTPKSPEGAPTPGKSEPRRVRAYVEDAVEARIVNGQRLPLDQEGATYSQLPSYGDGYAQLEGYRTPPRGVQEVMSWVERPGVKFTGVYFKAEEKPYLNGHAYVSDPFVRFKPTHPSEINQLAVEAERGTRFSNRPDPQPSASHTKAIFHPTMRPRPLKIMLDIYPMVPEPPTGVFPVEFTEHRGKRQRVPPGPAPNRMIVHLNLYPKKSSRMTRRRPILGGGAIAEERVFEESDEEEEATDTTTEDFEIAYESTTTEQTELE